MEVLTNAKLAEIAFNDTILDITQGEMAGKVTAQQCFEVATGPQAAQMAAEIHDSRAAHIVHGKLALQQKH